MLNIFYKKIKNKRLHSLFFPGDKIYPYINNEKESFKTNSVNNARHYPPASNEWINSIYLYNNNNVKCLPVADDMADRIIRGYFSFSPTYKKQKSRRVEMKSRILSLNRILLGKSQIKHTNNKVIVTLYIYNRSKIFISKALNNLFNMFKLGPRKKAFLPKMNKTNKVIKKNKLIRANGYYSLPSNKVYRKQIENPKLTIIRMSKKPTCFAHKFIYNKGQKLSIFNLNRKINKTNTVEKINNITLNWETKKRISLKGFTNKYNLHNNLNNNTAKRYFKNKNVINLNYTSSDINLKYFIFKIRKSWSIFLANKYKSTVEMKTYNNFIKTAVYKNKHHLNFINIFNETTAGTYNKLLYGKLHEKSLHINIDFSDYNLKQKNVILSLKKRKIVKNMMYKMISLYRLINLSKTYNLQYANNEINHIITYKLNTYTKEMIYKIIKSRLLYKLRNKSAKKIKRISLLKKDSIEEIANIKRYVIAYIYKLDIISKLNVNKYKKAVNALIFDKVFNTFTADYYDKTHRKEMLYIQYIKMLIFNTNKHKEWFLFGLKKIICQIYKKNVVFNLVNLKYLHLNSDIFSESIAMKLRNRDNKLLSVMKSSLTLVNVPYRNRKIITNKNSLNSVLFKNDILDRWLEKIYKQESFSYTRYNNLNMQNDIINNLKYKASFGVRVEAKGRLSKRLTASRSLFKMKYKGGLKNEDSSNYSLSSVILKGNTRPNVNYTNINNKTRNGSFGLKVWLNGQ